MSYTRSYSSSVTVSGSKSVSYPASQYGGTTTVSYSETVPININITVETSPFDNSVNRAGRNVDELTASVAAMNAANCAAIKANSEKVSQSLVKGFYNLINNDIALKKSENNSQLQSKIALLNALANDTRDKHARMSEDIERLRTHYNTIFKGLDEDLAKRIKEIDKPAFNISENIRKGIILKPYLSMAASTVSDADSDQQTKSSITIARIRRKVSEVIETMADSLGKNLLYRRMMKDTLWHTRADEAAPIYVPVAYMLSDGINSAGTADEYYSSDNGCKDRIISSVSSFVRSKDAAEASAIPEEELKLIDQAFSSMVEESFLNQDNTDSYNERVYSEILRLWHSGKAELKQI